jgi:hypothetical protein
LWRDVTSVFVLEPHEAAILRAACVIADTLGRLAAELSGAPSVVSDSGVKAAREFQHQSLVLGRLLAQLRLPVTDEAGGRPQRRGVRGFYVVSGGA